MSEIQVIIQVDPVEIENFHAESQEGNDWGNINAPFDANNLSKNIGTSDSWYQHIETGQTITFQLSNLAPDYDIEIEFIRLNPLGTINYNSKSPRQVWGQVVDLMQTEGAIGEFGAFYLRDPKPDTSAPTYSLVASEFLNDLSPNLSYTILFSFEGLSTGNRHYCTIDPLIRTSSKVTF